MSKIGNIVFCKVAYSSLVSIPDEVLRDHFVRGTVVDHPSREKDHDLYVGMLVAKQLWSEK